MTAPADRSFEARRRLKSLEPAVLENTRQSEIAENRSIPSIDEDVCLKGKIVNVSEHGLQEAVPTDLMSPW